MARQSDLENLYKRISLEFLSSFPGHVYLRFEPFSKAPAIMVQVLPGDIVAISQLADPGIVSVEEVDDLPADDDFQPGDS